MKEVKKTESNLPKVFVIRAESGNLVGKFQQYGCAAVGWLNDFDLSLLSNSEIQQRLSQVDNSKTTASISQIAGQVDRFTKKIAVGDYIITSMDNTKLLWGRVSKGYYHESKADDLPYNQRIKVDWDSNIIEREDLSPGLQNSLKSSLTVFLIDNKHAKRLNNHSEFFKLIGRKRFAKEYWEADQNFSLRFNGVVIKKIEIRNFRSLVNLTLDITHHYLLLIGNNDSGKSNILKALNLFFTGESDLNQKFNFQRDFSKNASVGKNKAEEIVIRLTLLPPLSYSDFQEVTWEKRWRSEGEIKEKELIIPIDISSRSSIHGWLRKLHYHYVPAIKGKEFFQHLLAQLHDALAKKWEPEFKTASKNLIQVINEKTLEISQKITEDLNFNSKIQVPEDLKPLFSALDFETQNSDLSVLLSSRGDGIKVRHIPAILWFLSRVSAEGECIWGYEEPENNLELRQAFLSAEKFLNYSKEIQLFQTSHSPAFYSLAQKSPEQVETWYIYQDDERKTHCQSSNESVDFDDRMGVLPYITPIIEDKIKSIKEEKDALATEISKIKQEQSPTLFLEGESDKKFFEKAIKLFGCAKIWDNINIRIKDSKGGASWVASMLLAWHYSGNQNCCVGLFDSDNGGRQELARAKKHITNLCDKLVKKNHIKALVLPTPSYIPGDRNIPIMVEDFFNSKIMQYANSQGWLELKPNLSPEFQITNVFSALTTSFGETAIYYKTVARDHKTDFTNYVMNLDDADLFLEFKPIIEQLQKIFEFFQLPPVTI